MLVTSCYAPTDLQIYTKGEIARTRLILPPLFCSKNINIHSAPLRQSSVLILILEKCLMLLLCNQPVGPRALPCSVDELLQPHSHSHPSSSTPLALQGWAASTMGQRWGSICKITWSAAQNTYTKKKDSWAKQEGPALLLTWNAVMSITSLCELWAHTHSLDGISIASGGSAPWRGRGPALSPVLLVAGSPWSGLIRTDSN